MCKQCLHCKTSLTKRYKESQKQWLVRKYCNRKCSAYSKAYNKAFLLASKKRMIGNKINLGRKHDSRKRPPPMADETKQKIGLFNKGRYSGSKNHFWKGGVTPEHKRIRSSVEYKEWRVAVLERDNWRCQFCNIRQGWNKTEKKQIVIDADHIKPFSVFHELRLEVDNGRALCRDCHKKTPTWGRKAIRYTK